MTWPPDTHQDVRDAVTVLRGLPSHAEAQPGRFDPATSVYNVKASNTRRVRAALGAARAGTGLARLTFLGDSLTAGLGTNRGTEDAVSQLRAELARRGYSTGELVNSYNGGLADSRILSPLPDGYTFPWAAIPPGAPETMLVTGTGTVLEIVASTESLAATISIDGGADVTVTPPSAPPAGVQVFTISGLTSGEHTATVTSVIAGNGANFFVYAAGFREESGVVVQNAGMSGAKVSDWLDGAEWATVDATGLPTYSSGWTLLNPGNVDHDAIFIELGMNDRWQAVPVATFRTNLSQLVTFAQVRGASVFLVASNSPSDATATAPYWSEYAFVVYDVAGSADVPLLDLTDRWGLFADYNADGLARDLATDGVHLTVAGNAAKVASWLDLLTV